MTFIQLLFLAAALSMDAFAAAVCIGVTISEGAAKKSWIVGLYFGVFQAVMPVFGYGLAVKFTDYIIDFDHWIAFALLGFLGGKMIWESLKKEGCADSVCAAAEEASLKPARILPLALATSIDALAVGVSFAFLRVSLLPAITVIGAVTLIVSAAGVKLGRLCGQKFKSIAELAGGAVLAAIGVKILLEHLLGMHNS
ncbi:MAG: manganese efflux pump MntP family protein [Oscillospiraceae bacterium]|nr:manganese efflux pump MntP family protein [Oscillospiraceae bacterium]